MKSIMKKALPGIIVAFILLVASISAALADQLKWKTDRVYFKNDTLVIEGSFFNDAPIAVDRINEFKARVKILRNGEWRQIAAATFDSLDLFIKPGQFKRHTFRIHEVEPRRIGKWKVNTWMEYHYVNRRHDERHRHQNDWD